MVNQNRIVSEFLRLIKIDSISKKEREMANEIISILKEMGIETFEDNVGEIIGGNAGNLTFNIPGNKDVDSILLMAHIDTVMPGISKNPIIEGNIIKTDGKTILGGDDLAGVCCILEAIRVLKEKNIAHGNIEVVLSVAEEVGLLGSKNFKYSNLKSKYGFILDNGGEIGTVAISAPSQESVNVIVKGKAAHAGVEPEKGVSAIQIASDAIANMKLGRIDDETTANIGIIQGGRATNIVCDKVEIEAESRSRNPHKLIKQIEHMKECFLKSAEKFRGEIEFVSEKAYEGFNIQKDDPIISILKEASNEIGVNLKLESSGGGSDTNIVNNNGIKAVNISVGMNKVHTVDEEININDLVKGTEFLISIIKSIK